jgi:replicative DNA helicase
MNPVYGLEHAVLGACLLENWYGVVQPVLRAEHFSCDDKLDNQLLFTIMDKLYPDRPISFLTVAEQYRNKQGRNHQAVDYYLAEYTVHVIQPWHIRHHALQLWENHVRKEMIFILDEAIKEFKTTIDAVNQREACEAFRQQLTNYQQDLLQVFRYHLPRLLQVGARSVHKSLLYCGVERLEEVKKLRTQARYRTISENLRRLERSPHGLDLMSQDALTVLVEGAEQLLNTGTLDAFHITYIKNTIDRLLHER